MSIIVSADLDIGYITRDDEEDTITVKVWTECDNELDAQALIKKLTDSEINGDDVLSHMGSNASDDFSSVHGCAYASKAKIAKKAPTGSKAFRFDEGNFTYTPM